MYLKKSFLSERVSEIPHYESELGESMNSERRKGKRFTTGAEHRKQNICFMVISLTH